MKLQYKVILLILAILIFVGVPGAVILLVTQRHAADTQFEDSALTLAKVLYDSLAHDMTEANQKHIQDAVLIIAERPYINEVVIVSRNQTVYASGEISEIGHRRNDEHIAEAIALGEVRTRSEEQYGNSETCVILPVFNEFECYPCHGPEAEVLGAIEVGINRRPLNTQVWDQSLILGLIAGLTFLTVGGSLAFMFRSAVVGPLHKLGASARAIADGDFSARAETKTNDEIGMVARAFNDMAERIQLYAQELETSKKELEQRVQERTVELQQMATLRGQLLERLISAQEEERRRIARELHDEASQALTMIMMDLSRAMDALPSEAKEATERLSQSRHLAEQTLDELRKLIYDLRPEVLDQLGLIPALRSYAKSRLEAENIKTTFHFEGLKERLSPQVETTLFRIIQEAVTNIIRHATASNVSVDVVRMDSFVAATITDDGKGFDVEAALEAPESWGLRGIRERVAVVGGDLNIESKPQQGTRIRFEIPL